MNSSSIIVDVRKLDTNSKLKGTAEVTIELPELGELTFTARIVELPSGPWVALPQSEYVKDGQKKYNEVIKLSKGLKKKIDELVLEKFGQLPAA